MISTKEICIGDSKAVRPAGFYSQKMLYVQIESSKLGFAFKSSRIGFGHFLTTLALRASKAKANQWTGERTLWGESGGLSLLPNGKGF
uniref:Uncharacterized protein n=1 Tax=Steinernema glaseri TaxID=37863 RepID=A0A1I7ZXB6_9BILA